MKYRQRVMRIEAYQRTRLPPSHFVISVCTPWDLRSMDPTRGCRKSHLRLWRAGCPELRIGALVLQRKPRVPEAWGARAQQYYAQRRHHDA